MNTSQFKLTSVCSITLECKAAPGVHVSNAVREALILALVNECEVTMVHNDRRYIVSPNHAVTAVLSR